MRRAFAVGYFVSWIVAMAGISFAAVAMLWSMAGLSARTGIDDDLTLLALPLGAVLGAWIGARARHVRLIHRILGVLGIGVAVTAGVAANWFLQSSALAQGAGPAAGLGELFAVALSACIILTGACMVGIWVFATLGRFADSGSRTGKVGPA
jgi:hypothetical protein